jgi:hypothetical protein
MNERKVLTSRDSERKWIIGNNTDAYVRKSSEHAPDIHRQGSNTRSITSL